MNSKTKIDITPEKVKELFRTAGYTVQGEPIPVTDREFNVIFSIPTNSGELIIKLSPNDESTILTYEKNIMQRELLFYKLIAEKTDIPVPKILYSDFSRKMIPCDFFYNGKNQWRHTGQNILYRRAKTRSHSEYTFGVSHYQRDRLWLQQ